MRSVAAAPDEPPDIIVILIDDMPGIDDWVLSRLPNIRRTFLEQGVRFTDFHGETPLCCPGRATARPWGLPPYPTG